MFAWNCAEAGGKHLGTCVDRFYFGSCCKLPDVISSNELGDNEGSLEDTKPSPDENIAAPATTARPSTTTVTTTSVSTSTTTTATTTTATIITGETTIQRDNLSF